MARIVVIAAAQPIMTPDDARAGMPALSDVDETVLTALIAAATGEIDGPDGWLGRAIGMQTLELQLPTFPACGGITLPLPPIVEPISVTYADCDGTDVVLPGEDYVLRGEQLFMKSSSLGWPSGRHVRIQYKAGYQTVPSQVKIAVQLRAGELAAQFGRDGSLKKEVVEGIGSFEYDVGSSTQSSPTSRAIEALLGGLRVLNV